MFSSFPLTCRQLRPRTHCVRFYQIVCRDRDHVLVFCNLLQVNPDLRSFVRSIAVQPSLLSSFPLLHIPLHLPEHVRVFRQELSRSCDGSGFAPAILASLISGDSGPTYKAYGLSFATNLQFARPLLAFPSVVYLSFADINIEMAGDEEHLDFDQAMSA